MKICPKCKTQLADAANFCYICGENMQTASVEASNCATKQEGKGNSSENPYALENIFVVIFAVAMSVLVYLVS